MSWPQQLHVQINGQAACSPVGFATPPTVPAPAPLHPCQAPLRPCQALPRPQIQVLLPAKQHPRQARQRQHQRSSRRRTQSPPPPRVQTHPCPNVFAKKKTCYLSILIYFSFYSISPSTIIPTFFHLSFGHI